MEIREIASQALLKEYEFVESLIPMYGRFQIQIVGFAVLVYTAVLGLIATTVAKQSETGGSVQQAGQAQTDGISQALTGVVNGSLALLPWVVVILALIFLVTETRIMRASRHIRTRTAGSLHHLLDGQVVLTWEGDPGSQLNLWERFLSTSIPFILAVSLLGITAGGWYLFRPVDPIPVPWGWTASGFALAIMIAGYSSIVTFIQEILGRGSQLAHGGGVKAYVLIETAVGRTRDVTNQLRSLAAVETVDMLTGPYDVVAVVNAPDLNTVVEVVTRQVQHIDGITRTTISLVG